MNPHYTAGVSATLPACVVAGCLLTQAWNPRHRFAAAAATWVVALLMAKPVLQAVTGGLASRSEATRSALEDMKEISVQTAGLNRVIDFAY